MLTYYHHQRKYVYPALAFLIIALFMLRAVAADGAPPFAPGLRPVNGVDAVGYDINRITDQLHSAADSLGDRITARDNRGDLETRLMRQEYNARSLEDNLFDNRADNFRTTHNDNRYIQDRRNLDETRAREQREYRQRRRDIEARMTGENRSTTEFSRLQSELNELDRRHAAQERSYEREFRNMDARYSSNRR